MQRLNLSGTLMLGNIKLFHFTIVNDCCTEFTRLSEKTEKYPCGCDPKEFPRYMENLVYFFYDRTTPPTRQFIDEDLRKMGIPYYEMGTLIRKQHGRSISDSFWLIPDE